MNKSWQLRVLTAYLVLGAPLGTSCAKEANTLEDEPEGNGGSSTAGGSSKSGSTGKGGATGAFGGTNATSGSAGKTMADGGEEPIAEGGEGTGGSAGSSGGGGTAGAGGMVGVPPDVLANASVVLHYQTDKATADTQVIFMRMFIENKSDDPLPMASVKVRYWFTSEAASPMLKTFHQGTNITGQTNSFVLDAGNSHVLTTFSGNTITKGADLNGSEFQLQIEGGAQNQSNDWSWQPAYASRMPHDKITVYLADKLIWGCEPPEAGGACFDDEPGAGGNGAGGAN
jgi:hypothetical protein